MIQTSTPPKVRIRYGAGIGRQLFGVSVALGLSYVFWQSGISGFPAVIWFSFAALVILFCLTFGDTQFYDAPPRVFRRWRFLGFIPIWRREFPLNRFVGVQRYGPTTEDSTWMVGLVEPSGRFLAVQWSCGPCAEANGYALHLSEITGLPLVETSVTMR